MKQIPAGKLGGTEVILLDTSTLVWAVADHKRLSPRALAAITLWELAALIARGRIRAYGTLEDSVRLLIEGVTVKPLSPGVAALAVQFPNDYPRDPATRLIGATARAEALPLVTGDEQIRRSNLLETIW